MGYVRFLRHLSTAEYANLDSDDCGVWVYNPVEEATSSQFEKCARTHDDIRGDKSETCADLHSKIHIIIDIGGQRRVLTETRWRSLSIWRAVVSLM